NDVKVFGFQGADVQVNLYYAGSQNNANSPVMQTFNLTFPSSVQGPWPVPQGAPQGQLNPVAKDATPKPTQNSPTADVSTWISMPATAAAFGLPLPAAANPGGQGMRQWYWTGNGCFFANAAFNRVTAPPAYRGGINFDTSLQASWSFATRL